MLCLASCLPLIYCRGSQAVLIRTELSLPFSPAEHLTTRVFSNAASVCREARQTFSISRSSTCPSGVAEISQKAGQLVLGDCNTHTQKNSNIWINLSLGKEISSSRRKKEIRKAASGLHPELRSYLRSRVAVEKAGRMCISSRMSSQLCACTSSEDIDLDWLLERIFF